jgi:hypothetical protein
VATGLLLAAPGLTDGVLSLVHNNQVHYGGHLLAGRIFSLFPHTAALAEEQYARGLYHAATPRQAALLTSARPTSMRARVAEAPQLAAGAIRHVSRLLPAHPEGASIG